MRTTDWLLLWIAAILIVGVGEIVRSNRRRSADTEMMRTALYAIANRYGSSQMPLTVTLEPSVHQALKRFQQTAVDIQGSIELATRWAAFHIPTEILEEMGIPDDWRPKNKQGIQRTAFGTTNKEE